MANINDYIRWRGDLPINSKFPFNEIDSMIMARFSYLLFERISMDKIETIESLSLKLDKFANDEFRYNGDKELITELGRSPRFKDLKVTDFVRNNELENEKQFSAIVIHLPKNEIYVSYIGTDATLYGWKEDFNMAFMDDVPCQSAGKEYLEKVASKYKRKKIRIGGHSKGGNVAIYSAITVDRQIQDRIIKVYNYDGPGFNSKVIKKYAKAHILDKIESYFPQDSMIGRLLNHKEKYKISLSNEKGFYQHNIYSWQVLKTDLVFSETHTKNSEIMNKTVVSWLENTTPEQRKICVDTIFEILYSTEADTFKDLSKNLAKSLPVIMKKYDEISKEDRKMMTNVILEFVKIYVNLSLNNEKNEVKGKFSRLKKVKE